MSQQWTERSMPDQTGKVVVITGASSGFGLRASHAFAKQRAHVVMAVRDVAKGQQAVQEIKETVRNSSIDVLELDLANLQSIRRFDEIYTERYPQLDILLNNAGVMRIPYRQTEDGFEMQFGTNHLGHFALTGLLLPHLLQSAEARVVTVSSTRHRPGHIDFENLNAEKHYDPAAAYSQSKLANLLFTYELQRQLTMHSMNTISVAAHPGYAATNLQFVGPHMQGARLLESFMAFGNRFFAQSAAMGTLPILYAATMPDVKGGEFFGPDGLGELRGYPRRVTSNRESYDAEIANRLWTVSEALTGVHYKDQFSKINAHRKAF